jgi:hypothetical protein
MLAALVTAVENGPGAAAIIDVPAIRALPGNRFALPSG